MNRRFKIIYNPYFHLPMLLWIIAGALLMQAFSMRQLFETVNTHYNASTDVLMVLITRMGQTEVIVPSLLGLMLLPAFRTKWYFFAGLVSNIVPFLMQQWIKRIYHAPRPLYYFNRAAWIHYLPQWPELLRDSFPSGHSQGAFSFFCFLSMLLPSKYRAFGLVFFILALLVGYSRMYLAAHFFRDVYVGSIIGTITTTLLYSLFEYYKPQPVTEAVNT